MALTEIKTSGIADDAVTTDKLANAINTARDANTAKVSLADNAVTLAKMAGGTDGQIITYDASGDPVAVGPGTDGQVLTSTGAGSPPAFETPAAGVGGATGVDFNDNVKARFGTDNDLEISHNDTNGWIDNNKGALYIDTTTDIVARVNNNEDAIKAIANGAVELYYDSSKKFETNSAGTAVTGYQTQSAFPIAITSHSSAVDVSSDILDSGNCYDHIEVNQGSHFDASTGRFTCPVAGVYRLYVRFSIDNSSTNVRLRKNGSTLMEAYADQQFQTQSGKGSVSGEMICSCAANDYLDVGIATLKTMSGSHHKTFNFHLIA